MIQDVQRARRISDLMLSIGQELDGSVVSVEAAGSRNELLAYRRAVGRIMGEILMEVLNPLYDRHPTLRPEGLD